WGPGVQSGNSSYGEDRVIPLRWIGSLKSGSTHSLVLRYDMSRGGRGVFIDSVASWDATEVGVDVAKGVTLGGPATTWPIKVDSGLPPHAQRGGNLTTYNVQELSFGDYTTTDGVRGIRITFTVAGSSGNRVVVI